MARWTELRRPLAVLRPDIGVVWDVLAPIEAEDLPSPLASGPGPGFFFPSPLLAPP